MHFIKNSYERFSKTDSTDPGQRVPLIKEILGSNYEDGLEKMDRL